MMSRDIMLEKPELALKTASRDLIAAVGGTDGAAETLSARGTRVRQQRMSDCQNAFLGRFLHLDEVGRLEDVALRTPAWPAVTRALADRHGFDLVRRIEAVPTSADWCDAIGLAMKEFGDVQLKIVAALPGGVTPREIREGDIRGEIAQAIAVLRQIDGLAEAALEGDTS